MKLPLLGGVIALAVILVDQIVKAGVLSYSNGSDVDSTPLGPFLDLTLRWNRGISFSLFAGDSAVGQATLLALTLGRDRLASLVAVPVPVRSAGGGPWIDYRRRPGQRHRSTRAWSGH